MRAVVYSFVLSATLCGCTHLELPSQSPLAALPQVKNSVVLDVLFVRFPLGDPEVNADVWREIDELHLTPDERRRLESNGLRAGVLSGPLPLKLEQLLQLSESSQQPTGPQPVDVEQRPAAKQRQLRIRGGRRANIVVMGEQQRRNEMSLLIRGADDRVEGRTYQQVQGLFAARAFPQGDGGVRLEMTPELEHGEAQKRFTAGEGMFKVEFGPPHEVIEQLRWSARLAPGQMLVVSMLPERIGSLGYQFFSELDGDATVQKMLLVRLTQCEYDDRFGEAPVTSAEDEP